MLHVVVADTKTLRVFEVPQRTLREVAAFHHDAGKHERDLVTDRPGRVINGASGAHQAYEPSVPASRHTLHRWLKEVGTALVELLDTRSNDALILVASSRLLGELRRALPRTLRTRVRAEVARDVVREPLQSLNRRLQPVLRSAAHAGLRGRPMHRPVFARDRPPQPA